MSGENKAAHLCWRVKRVLPSSANSTGFPWPGEGHDDAFGGPGDGQSAIAHDLYARIGWSPGLGLLQVFLLSQKVSALLSSVYNVILKCIADIEESEISSPTWPSQLP